MVATGVVVLGGIVVATVNPVVAPVVTGTVLSDTPVGTDALPPEPVVEAEPVGAALKAAQAASPALMACWRSLPTVQALRRQPATVAAMADLVGPHWQATSVAAHPTAEMAEARQEVAQAGCPPRSWARPAAAKRERMAAVFIVKCGFG